MPTVAALLFFAPLLFFAARLFQRRRTAAQAFSVILAVAAGVVFSLRHHQDIRSGVDTAAYALLADSIRSGEPLVGPDPLFSMIPGNIREAFLYRPIRARGGIALRPTRNLAYQLDIRKAGAMRRPFYMPAYSAAVAGSGLGRCFMPVAGALLLAVLMLGVTRLYGAKGLLPLAALVFATPYPAWFFRGDFPEVAGAILALSAFASHLAKPFSRPASFAAAGVALSFSLSFHATGILLAGPAVLLLIFGAPKLRHLLALAAGLAAGFLPLWFTTRRICAPYGDWTRLSTLSRVVFAATEHAAIFVALVLLAAAAVAAVAASRVPRARAFVLRLAQGAPAPAVFAAAVLPPLLLAAVPGPICARFRLGLAFALKSSLAPFLVLLALGFAAFARRGDARPKALVVLFCWSTCAYVLLFGHEAVATHGPAAGVWSFRRLCPAFLALASALAFTLPGLFELRLRKPAAPALASLFAVLACANPVRHPAAYFAVNGNGSEPFVREVLAGIDALRADLVVFDYFPAAVPYAVLRGNVLGLAPHAYAKWPDVARWLSDQAASGRRVFIASSYGDTPPCEEGFLLEKCATFSAARQVVKSKSFLDATPVATRESLSLSRLVPYGAAAPDAAIAQTLEFSGSPLALRGQWAKAARGGEWCRRGSAFIAPLPSPGTNVIARLDLEWTPPEGAPRTQMIAVRPQGESIVSLLTVPEGRHTIEAVFTSSKALPPAGQYDILVPRPFDPSAYSIRGFPGDLGVVFHGATLDAVAAGE